MEIEQLHKHMVRLLETLNSELKEFSPDSIDSLITQVHQLQESAYLLKFMAEKQGMDEEIQEIDEQPSRKDTLSNMLSLNDKYLYANELFNKNMDTFSEMIETIDNCSSLEEAKALLSDIDWDNDNATSFLSLLNRRFPQ